MSSAKIIPILEEQLHETLQPQRELPPIVRADELLKSPPSLPQELVNGILHRGSKMAIGGASKSFKTWMLLDLAISVQEGIPWLIWDTIKAKVLYINFEIQTPFIARRLEAVAAEKGLTELPALDVWNLRGYSTGLYDLLPSLLSRIKDARYDLIVLDPIYKVLGERDESNAGDIGEFCNELERIAVDTGAAVVFGAHFSKGNQSAKQSMDRISGSGVFARDVDSLLTLTAHETENVFVLEATLRNFPPHPDFCVKWEYPLMIPDPDSDPEDLKQPKSRASKAGIEPSAEEFLALFPKSWPEGNLEKALLSSAELQAAFAKSGWDKNTVPAVRKRLEGEGKIGVVTGLPRGKILVGLPDTVAAFNKHRETNWEKGAKRRKVMAQKRLEEYTPKGPA